MKKIHQAQKNMTEQIVQSQGCANTQMLRNVMHPTLMPNNTNINERQCQIMLMINANAKEY